MSDISLDRLIHWHERLSEGVRGIYLDGYVPLCEKSIEALKELGIARAKIEFLTRKIEFLVELPDLIDTISCDSVSKWGCKVLKELEGIG